MTPQFRTLPDGRVCCSSTNSRGERVEPTHPCPKCAAHFATTRAASSAPHFATTAATPPDPYASGLAALRATMPRPDRYPTPTTPALPLDARGVPDPYARDLAKRKEQAR